MRSNISCAFLSNGVTGSLMSVGDFVWELTAGTEQRRATAIRSLPAVRANKLANSQFKTY